MKHIILSILLFSVYSTESKAQSINSLQDSIYAVLNTKTAFVGVAIQGMYANDTLSINGDKHLPMQSVFKFHLALAVLNQVDKGRLRMDDTLLINKEMLSNYAHLWSPLRKKYPNGAELSIQEVLYNTVAWSDNLGCDMLIE